MTPDQWLQVKELFHEAAELAPEVRQAFLQERCNGDSEMLRELQLLLESHDEAEHFIEQPALASASEILSTDGGGSWTGRSVGQYRVIREIGRGGMGLVLLAVRADDQFKKRVAIKILRRGMDTEDILRRFRNERQILASLEHPNIARMFDGGMTDDSLPYFVMEYIEGEPLDKYADEHKLSTNHRLELFRTVCAAVQHAHQNLVVHRDLKPRNILVTSTGEPKLLDFGIAKVLNPELSNSRTELTRTEMRVLTPDYASPEQVRGEKLTTTSDIYSLGVVLYELLTGHRPYHATDATSHDLARIICEQEPAKPSTAVNTIEVVKHGDTEPQTTITPESVSRARDTEPDKLHRRLAGDLDNIVLMALRKEPQRRYESAAQLSSDIQRHLDGLPVIARQDTFAYRASKFIVRNKVGAAAAAIVFLAILAGLLVSIWQARVAARERNQAQQETAKAEAIKSFLERMLNYSNPVLTGKNSRETTVAEVLDEAARRLESGEFSNQPEIRAELELIIAKSYNGQGKYHLGNKYMQEYAALVNQLYGEHHPKTLVASARRAGVLFDSGEMTEAENIYRRILPPMREEQKKGNINAADLADALNGFGYLRRTQGDSREAEALFREALALNSQMSSDEWRLSNATIRCIMSSTIADQGRFDEALQTAREAVAEDQQRGETDNPNHGFNLTVLAGFLTDKGDFSEADANLHEAEAIFRKFFASPNLWWGDNLRNQSISLYNQGKYSEALSKATDTLNIYRELFGTHYDHYPTAMIIQGLSLTRLGQTKEGEKIVLEAVRMRTDSLPKEHYWMALARSPLGECLTIQKRYSEAEPLLIESYHSLVNSQGSNNPRTLLALRRLVALYENWGRTDAANEYRSKL